MKQQLKAKFKKNRIVCLLFWTALPHSITHQNKKRVLLPLLLLVQNKSEARHLFGHQQLLPWRVLLLVQVLQVNWVQLVLVVRTESLLCDQVLVVVVVIVLRICLQLKALVLMLWQPKSPLLHLISSTISQI